MEGEGSTQATLLDERKKLRNDVLELYLLDNLGSVDSRKHTQQNTQEIPEAKLLT